MTAEHQMTRAEALQSIRTPDMAAHLDAPP